MVSLKFLAITLLVISVTIFTLSSAGMLFAALSDKYDAAAALATVWAVGLGSSLISVGFLSLVQRKVNHG